MGNLKLSLAIVAVIISSGASCQKKKVWLTDPNNSLDGAVIARLPHCPIAFKLKEGMTNSEANDAIDGAFEGWAECMRQAQLPK